MSNVIEMRRSTADVLKDRVRAVGERRESSTVAMKQLVTPLLHAVNEIAESLGEPEIGINLGFTRDGGDVRFLGEMRVPEFHGMSKSVHVRPYEVRVMADIQGNPLLILESPVYSTHRNLHHDTEAVHRATEWHAVYGADGESSVSDLVALIRKSAERYVAVRDREAPDSHAL